MVMVFDDATESSTPDGSGLTNGFLYRGLNLLREVLDEPDVLSKYSDNRLLGFLEEAYAEVLGEYNRLSPNPLTTRYDLTLANTDEEQYYALPPTMGLILAIQLYDSDLNLKGHLLPRSLTNPSGPNYRVDGHTLWTRENVFNDGDIIRFYFVTSGSPRLHDGTAADISASTITLTSTPVRGTLDMRPNAYAGSLVRILGADTNYVMQERYISAYDATTRIATVKPDFSPLPGGTVVYEIGPLLGAVFDQAMTFRAGMSLCALEGISSTRRKAVFDEYQRRLRSIRLDASQSDLYAGITFRSDTALYEDN